MMDLDPVLSCWRGTTPWDHPLPGWARSCVGTTLTELGCAHGLTLTAYEPPEEEWICVQGPGAAAVTSALFPLAFVTSGLRDLLCRRLPQITLIPLASTVAFDYCASPRILRETLLRSGWSKDFSPSRFCVADLLIESVPSI